jgi:hypothetical protein
MYLNIKKCNTEDVKELALLNQQLIQDEQSDNQMTMSELEERMLQFITGRYEAYFFVANDENIGYALIDKTCNPIY